MSFHKFSMKVTTSTLNITNTSPTQKLPTWVETEVSQIVQKFTLRLFIQNGRGEMVTTAQSHVLVRLVWVATHTLPAPPPVVHTGCHATATFKALKISSLSH